MSRDIQISFKKPLVWRSSSEVHQHCSHHSRSVLCQDYLKTWTICPPRYWVLRPINLNSIILLFHTVQLSSVHVDLVPTRWSIAWSRLSFWGTRRLRRIRDVLEDPPVSVADKLSQSKREDGKSLQSFKLGLPVHLHTTIIELSARTKKTSFTGRRPSSVYTKRGMDISSY